jgi:carbonic anhydrase
LAISYKQLATREWLVIHHSNCSIELFTDEIIRGLLASSLETASHDGKGWKDIGKGPGSTQGDFIDWLTIANQAKSEPGAGSDCGMARRKPWHHQLAVN